MISKCFVSFSIIAKFPVKLIASKTSLIGVPSLKEAVNNLSPNTSEFKSIREKSMQWEV